MTTAAGSIRLGYGKAPVELLLGTANRHGLISGATGTGKTVTLRVLAEQFSQAGVPVFVPDIKGDLSGLARPGSASDKLQARLERVKLADFSFQAVPVVFWDVFGKAGHPLRTTISELGPLLVSRLLALNETQRGVLSIVFKVADDRGLWLLDLKDLRALLQHVTEHAAEYKTEYGHVSAASVGAIARSLLALEEQGAAHFFGEPALDHQDLLQTDGSRGVVNILVADALIQKPALYAMCLLFLLAELFEKLPEVGDLDQPKLVFIFDEAHLLFDAAHAPLQQRIEQVVRLIRSKGVGVYFATQNPLDIPAAVLGQLGLRVQHALRAFTPKDQKLIRSVAAGFRASADFSAERALGELAVGEALVSSLDAEGVPTPVERVWIDPPRSRFAPLSDAERREVIEHSPLFGHYDEAVDRESAYEQLAARTAEAPRMQQQPEPDAQPRRGRAGAQRRDDSVLGDAIDSFAKSAARAAGSRLGRQIMRGLFDSVLGSAAPRRGGRR